ncbi:hypothetical protein V2J09_000990 [Rumex salicifolius]
MNCLIWNVQGAGSKGFQRRCKYLLKQNRIDIVALMETRVSWHMTSDVRVEAVGFSGGLWLLWNNNNFHLSVVIVHDHFIHNRVTIEEDTLLLVVVYAPPTPQSRQNFWLGLETKLRDISEPLFIGGDFNCILTLEERQMGTDGRSPDFGKFAN